MSLTKVKCTEGGRQEHGGGGGGGGGGQGLLYSRYPRKIHVKSANGLIEL